MRCIVLGAGGRLGSRLLAECVRQGHQTTAFVRSSDRLKASIGKELFEAVEIIEGDVLDERSLRAALSGQEACFQVHIGDPHEQQSLGSTVQAAQQMPQCRRRTRPLLPPLPSCSARLPRAPPVPARACIHKTCLPLHTGGWLYRQDVGGQQAAAPAGGGGRAGSQRVAGRRPPPVGARRRRCAGAAVWAGLQMQGRCSWSFHLCCVAPVVDLILHQLLPGRTCQTLTAPRRPPSPLQARSTCPAAVACWWMCPASPFPST